MDNANAVEESYSDIRQALAKDIEDFTDVADVVTAVPNHPICCIL